MKTVLLGAVFIALSGTSCASAGEQTGLSEKAANRLAEFDRTGEIENCLNLAKISAITPLDPHHFLVRVGRSNYYLNETSGCSGAGRVGNRLQYRVSGSQLCRNQIVTVVDNTAGIIAGSCGLGGFEKLTKVP